MGQGPAERKQVSNIQYAAPIIEAAPVVELIETLAPAPLVTETIIQPATTMAAPMVTETFMQPTVLQPTTTMAAPMVTETFVQPTMSMGSAPVTIASAPMNLM